MEVRRGKVPWWRVVAGGVLWATVYNLPWGIAWFSFMRAEWLSAFSSIGQPMLWTAVVWYIWIALTLPMGMAAMAYAGSHSEAILRSAIVASMAVCALIVLGSDIWFIQSSFPIRVIALDSAVNIIGIGLSAVASGWFLAGGRFFWGT